MIATIPADGRPVLANGSGQLQSSSLPLWILMPNNLEIEGNCLQDTMEVTQSGGASPPKPSFAGLRFHAEDKLFLHIA